MHTKNFKIYKWSGRYEDSWTTGKLCKPRVKSGCRDSLVIMMCLGLDLSLKTIPEMGQLCIRANCAYFVLYAKQTNMHIYLTIITHLHVHILYQIIFTYLRHQGTTNENRVYLATILERINASFLSPPEHYLSGSKKQQRQIASSRANTLMADRCWSWGTNASGI